jgi:hypothetical protein
MCKAPTTRRAPTRGYRPAAARTRAFSRRRCDHVTRQRQLRVTVIGDVAPGARTELAVDLVEVVLVAKATLP